MNKYRFLLISLAAILMASCVEDNLSSPEVNNEDIAAAKKIINTAANADSGTLIFYVTEECASRIENAEVTRSGMTELDLLAMEIEASAIKPVFNLKVNGDEKRARGMHRWYTVDFPSTVALEDAAMKLAKIDYVETVQYAGKMQRPEAKPIMVDPATISSTRADEYPFNDPAMPMQWHYINKGRQSLYPGSIEGEDINVEPAWKLTTGRPEVVVAIVDEGVCYNHVDLEANMHVNEAELNGEDNVDDDNNGYVDDVYGYNFGLGGRVSYMRDGDQGHGTHVAGTIAAVNNNGVGVAGVAGGSGNGDGVRIFSAQIFSGKEDHANYAQTAAAIEYSADRGACILQCSWGFEPNAIQNDNEFQNDHRYSVEYEAIEYFISKKNCAALDGGLVIFAAGNEGQPIAGYPGAYRNYLAVTAFAPDGLPAYYTCYDKGCNISAPGGEYFLYNNSIQSTGCVYSTVAGPNVKPANEGYAYMQGTSMACPHVSGVAALGLSYALDLGKTFTVDQFKALLTTSVNAFPDSAFQGYKDHAEGGSMNLASYRNKMGTGKIDAYRLLMAIRGVSCVPVSTKETNYIDFSKFVGKDGLEMKVADYDISEDTIEALGIVFDQFTSGKVVLQCSKAGVGTIKVGMIAGGTMEGSGIITAGMRIEREFALIARPDVETDENGNPIKSDGWL
ncbi:MAG: S8 family serine peptidase [Alistipes sp.]|nr:S8 family serine peptidase [Alistipes sp.]MBQ8367417.1 S8 family serine peptidase [Alistipes sp.]